MTETSALGANAQQEHSEENHDEQQLPAGVHVDMPPPAPPALGSVQRLLEKEGPDARNVVSWLVPNRTGGGPGGLGSGLVFDARAGASTSGRGQRPERRSREASRERELGRRRSPIASPFKSSNGSISSKSTPNFRGRSCSDSTAQGFNQRLWGYLFRNVNRAVDELYYLCEAEGSASHCTEAAELLEGCGRDFTKLVERIADQTRFEEEQRVARAAERVSPEGEGGDSSLETINRKPKGLVWEVRKTTSASGASAMVLNAIERMENHASPRELPSAGGGGRAVPTSDASSPPLADPGRYSCSAAVTPTLEPRSLRLASAGGSEGSVTTKASKASEKGGGEQQRQSKRSEDCSSSAAGITISFGCLDEMTEDEGEDTANPTVSGDNTGVGRDKTAAGKSVTVDRIIFDEDVSVARDASSAIPDEDEHGEGACRVEGKGEREADPQDGSEKLAEGARRNTIASARKGARLPMMGSMEGDGEDNAGVCTGKGAAACKSAASSDASVLDPKTPNDRERSTGASTSGGAVAAGSATTGARGTMPGSPSGIATVANTRRVTSSAKNNERSDVGCGSGGGVRSDKSSLVLRNPRIGQSGSRLNPRAAPFTYSPGASTTAKVPSARSDLSGRVGCDKPVNMTRQKASATGKIPAPPASGSNTSTAEGLCSTRSHTAVSGSEVPSNRACASGVINTVNKNDNIMDVVGTAVVGDCRTPPTKHDVAPPPPSSPPADDFVNRQSSGSAAKRGSSSGDSGTARAVGEECGVKDVDPGSSAKSAESQAAAVAVPVPVAIAGGGGEDAQGIKKHEVEKAPQHVCLLPESKWSRRPRLTPDGPGKQKASHTVRNPASSPSQRSSSSKTTLNASHKVFTPNDCPSGSASSPTMQAFTDPSASDTAGGCRVGPKPLPSAESTGAKGQRQSVGDHPIGRSHLDQEPSSPDSKISGVLGRDRGEATDGAVDQATEIQLDDTRSEGLEDGAGTETECDDPDSAYVNAMEEIWAEAEAWVDAEAQAEEELWARLPTDLPCLSESEDVVSDVEEACRPNARARDTRTCEGDERNIHDELEIEIPLEEDDEEPGDDDFEEEEEEQSPQRGRLGSGDAGCGSLSCWYRAEHHPALGYEEDEDEADMDNEEHCASLTEKSDSGEPTGRLWSSPKSSGSPSLRAGEGSSVYNPARSESSSGASCFGNERGSQDAFDEGWAPFSHRELQKKLSSPQRNPQRKILSAAEAKLRQERRQMVAELNRAQLASGMAEKLKQHGERARVVRFRKEEQLLKAEEEARRRMEGADARRREHRRGIVRKANDANSKVEEVLFMNKLTVEDLKITLQMKLAEVDRRIQSGRARRQQLLTGISDRQRKRTKDKAAQMSERRLEAEEAAAMRWEALQKRLEAVQERRRDRERETCRRMQATDRHNQARERREAMMHQLVADKAGRRQHGRRKEPPGEISRRKSGASKSSQPHRDVDRSIPKRRIASVDGEPGRASEEKQERSPEIGVVAASEEHRTQLPRNGSTSAVGKRSKGGLATGGGGDHCESGVGPNDRALPSSLRAPHSMVGESAVVKRGRSQKKRAKKVKDKMRQLCLEVAAAAATAPSVSGAADGTSTTTADLQSGATVSGHAVGDGATSAGSDACGGVGNENGRQRLKPAGVSPWPRLERAARDLSALAWARAQHYRDTAAGETPERNSAPHRLLTASDMSVAAGASTNSNGKVGAVVAAIAGVDVEQSRADATGSLSPSTQSGREGVPAEHDCVESGVSGARARDTVGVVTEKGPAGGDDSEASEHGNARDEDGTSQSSSVPPRQKGDKQSAPTLGDAHFPAEETTAQTAQTSVRDTNARPAEVSIVATGAAAASDGDYGSPDQSAATARSHKKTRRGKRAGGAINRRRGAKERAAGCARRASGETMAEDGKTNTDVDVSATRAGKGGTGKPKDVAAKPQEAATFPSRSLQQTEGATVEQEVDGSSRGTGVHGEAIICCAKTIPGAGEAPRGGNGSLRADVPRLESAAMRSIRELRSMFASSPGSDPAATTSGSAPLQSQVRTRGILESLVALCAPFPWWPVPLSASAHQPLPPLLPGVRVNSSPASGFVDSAVDVGVKQSAAPAAIDVVATSTSRSSDKGDPGNSGVRREDHTPEAPPGPTSGSDRGGTKARGGTVGGSGHEVLTESALGILLIAFVEPKSRDHVLRIDGAAPLVDCLSRLLERATRNESATKHSHGRPAAFSFKDARAVMVGISPNRRAKGWTAPSPAESKSLRKSSKAGRDGSGKRFSADVDYGDRAGRAVFPPDSEAPRRQVSGLEAGVEEALLTALRVLTRLLRHEASDKACSMIQEELVRYLIAKRLLSDLAVLVCQLHPYCDAPTAVSRGHRGSSNGKPKLSPSPSGRKGPMAAPGLSSPRAAASSGRYRSASPPLSLRRRTRVSDPSSLQSAAAASQQQQQLLPLSHLVLPIAELVEAVISYPLRRPTVQETATPPSPTPPPPPPSREASETPMPSSAAKPPDSPPSTTGAVPAPAKKHSPPGDGEASSPFAGGPGCEGYAGNAAASSECGGRCGDGESLPASDRNVLVCRNLDEMRDGSLAARPGGARLMGGAPGMARVVVELMSLLAAMAGTEGNMRRAQERSEGEAGSRDAVPLPDSLLRLVDVVVRASTQACLIDLGMMQEAFSAEGVQQEFTFLCDHALASLIEKVDSQEVASPDPKPSELEGWLESLVCLLGYFCLGNRRHQEVLQWGPPPTILVRLCNLPFRYFSEPMHQAVLFPTLISICLRNVRNRDVAENDLAKELLAEFLEDNLRSHRASESSLEEACGTRRGSDTAATAPWRLLSLRFPLNMWEGAIEFFRAPS